MSDQARKTYVHIVRERYCKGCGICVAFCPKKLLTLKAGKVVVERPELCVGCRMCELRCPDYAIEVSESDSARESGRSGGSIDFTIPPEAMHD
jgi:2-oxoglutarate ferredoxin oxidoreductase subunit delta